MINCLSKTKVGSLFWVLIFLLLPALVHAQGPEWQVFKSTHFIVYYKNASENQVSELANRAEGYYDSIAEQFGFNRFNFWTWDNRARIYLYDNKEDYQNSTRSYNWSGGHVWVNQKLIQVYAQDEQCLNNILPHELAHIIFLEMVGYNNPAAPLWLQEGVATYQEQAYSMVKEILAQRIKENDYLDLQALSYFQAAGQNNDRVTLFYQESNSLVKFLIAQFGKEAFVEFCRSLRDSRNLITALRRVYAFNSLNELETAWKAYILR